MHPGYGFLSESAEFVEGMEEAGVSFLGPTAETMRKFSRKHTAREFAISADVPVLPGEHLCRSKHFLTSPQGQHQTKGTQIALVIRPCIKGDPAQYWF